MLLALGDEGFSELPDCEWTYHVEKSNKEQLERDLPRIGEHIEKQGFTKLVFCVWKHDERTIKGKRGRVAVCYIGVNK